MSNNWRHNAGGLEDEKQREAHTIAVDALPPLHKDPFARLLLAQARVEVFELVTADGVLAAYGDGVKRV